MIRSIGFIGAGRVATLMIRGFERKQPHAFTYYVSDTSADALDRMRAAHPDVVTSLNDNTLPAQCDIVFIALHPPVLIDTLKELKGLIAPSSVVVSLAPKITLHRISESLGGDVHVGRMIPNAPSVVNSGYNPVCFPPVMPAELKRNILSLFAVLGDTREVPEEQLESYAIITAMGPTYLWFQLYKLLSLAESFGIPHENALEAIIKMAEGAGQTMADCDLSPEAIMDLVALKPLKEDETMIASAYDARLQPLYAKLKS